MTSVLAFDKTDSTRLRGNGIPQKRLYCPQCPCAKMCELALWLVEIQDRLDNLPKQLRPV